VKPDCSNAVRSCSGTAVRIRLTELRRNARSSIETTAQSPTPLEFHHSSPNNGFLQAAPS
jgi:hypothetical protein